MNNYNLKEIIKKHKFTLEYKNTILRIIWDKTEIKNIKKTIKKYNKFLLELNEILFIIEKNKQETITDNDLWRLMLLMKKTEELILINDI